MKTALAIALLIASGCAPYTEAQMRLAEQSRRGIELCRAAHAEREQFIEQYFKVQRSRLDDAFDADVRETEMLDPDWVIEHRRAYAAAIDVFAAQRLASLEAGRTLSRNLDAIDAALSRILVLQQAQLRLFDLSKTNSTNSTGDHP